MSQLVINVPDDRWFRSDLPVRPSDGMLCVIVHRYGNCSPCIVQYIKNEDLFMDVSEKWLIDCYESNDWEPSYTPWSVITMWKPLGLLDKDNERMLADIENYFKENKTC